MAYRIEWSPRAVEDLEAIAEYIGLDSNAYAKAVVKKIVEVTRNFARFPRAGRIVPELATKTFVNGSPTATESYTALMKTYSPSRRSFTAGVCCPQPLRNLYHTKKPHFAHNAGCNTAAVWQCTLAGPVNHASVGAK